MLNVRLPPALKREIERRSQAQGLKVSEAVRHVLQAEAAGILAWAVVGCLAWQREGLGSPPAVQEATEAYRLEQDRLGQFLADCTVTGPQGSVRAADLYRAYERWCRDSGDQPMSGTAFGRQMAERCGCQPALVVAPAVRGNKKGVAQATPLGGSDGDRFCGSRYGPDLPIGDTHR
jgi:hypothetical protein